MVMFNILSGSWSGGAQGPGHQVVHPRLSAPDDVPGQRDRGQLPPQPGDPQQVPARRHRQLHHVQPALCVKGECDICDILTLIQLILSPPMGQPNDFQHSTLNPPLSLPLKIL